MNAQQTPVPRIVHTQPAPIIRQYPVIGDRWRPGVIERRDTETGFYEVVNSAVTTQAEVAIQRALLAPISKATARRIEQAHAASHATSGRTTS